jgi:hypothetical protein
MVRAASDRVVLGGDVPSEIGVWVTQRVAYELWRQRGQPMWDSFTDWLAAEAMLSERRIGDLAVRAMAECPRLAELERLALEEQGIGDSGVSALAGSPYVAGLKELYLERNRIGAAGARALAESPHLARLTKLDLAGNPLGDAGAQAICSSPQLEKLKQLKLSRDGLSEETRELLKSRFKRRLKFD